MIDYALERAIVFSLPLVGALVCFVITAIDVNRSTHPVRRKMHLRALGTYGMFALSWFLLVPHSIFPAFYVRSMPLFVPAVMLSYVLLYRMARTLTDTGDGGNFSKIHYIAPAVMFVVMVALWFANPIDRISAIIYATPAKSPFAYLVLGVSFSYGIAYPIASLVRIWRFLYRREKIEGAANGAGVAKIETAGIAKGIAAELISVHRRTLTRLFWAMLLEVIVVPIPLFGLLWGIAPFTGGGLVWLFAVLPSRVIYILSCFNLLSDNYMVIDTDRPGTEPSDGSPTRLGRERVEHYIETRKPWLNPAFRINDMAEDLFSNRAYISAFINAEYGMHFTRFVNSFRLKEVERLREEARRKRQHVSSLQLILNAGFSSYRSYLRAKEYAASGDDGDDGDGENDDENVGDKSDE